METFMIEVVNGSAVAGHYALEVPVLAKNLLEQAVVSAARLAVESVVGTHYLGDMRILDQGLECRQVCLPQIPFRQTLDVENVPVPFRPAVHCKMFGASKRLSVLAVFRPLKPSYDGRTHPASQIRVFAISLLAAPPARVSEYVDVRSPE